MGSIKKYAQEICIITDDQHYTIKFQNEDDKWNGLLDIFHKLVDKNKPLKWRSSKKLPRTVYNWKIKLRTDIP